MMQSEAFDLLLLRHGNTFESGERVVWLGECDDPPLTLTGRKQMLSSAAAIAQADLLPRVIVCAPYRRTSEAAELIAAQSPGVRIVLDRRLCELDYGEWTGLTNAEIESRYGPEFLQAWLDHGVWPQYSGWRSNAAEIEGEVVALACQLLADSGGTNTPTLVISTNSRLRYFLKLVPGAFETRARCGAIKIGIGNLGRLRYECGEWDLLGWNYGIDLQV